MAQNALYTGEQDGGTIFQIGRIGFDTGAKDAGAAAFGGNLKTEHISPAGTGGLVQFRRIELRVLYSGEFTITVTVYVDGEQTQKYDSNSNLVNQNATFKRGPASEKEETLEMDIDAVGTSIQVEVEVVSSNVTSFLLFEGINGHSRIIRKSESREAEVD